MWRTVELSYNLLYTLTCIYCIYIMYIYRDPTINLIYRILYYLEEIISMFFLMYNMMNSIRI